MYKKQFPALESDPTIFSDLMCKLGMNGTLGFIDICSLEEEELKYIQRPVLAVIVIFPDNAENVPLRGFSKASEAQRQADVVVWAKQTINNACGFYAILHAVCNGVAKEYIAPDSVLQAIIDASRKSEKDLARVVEESNEIETSYIEAAGKGSTPVPDPHEEVDHHYICFTKATKSSVWALDGERDGPFVSEESSEADLDVLSGPNLGMVRRFIQDLEKGHSDSFAMMALVQRSSFETMTQEIFIT